MAAKKLTKAEKLVNEQMMAERDNSIAPLPSEAVAAQIRILQQLTLDIDVALRGRMLPATERSRMAFGCLDLAIEHTSGIAVLVDQPLWGPAFALLRVQLEAFIRGVWLARCAKENQLKWFKNGKLDKHRNFGQLVMEARIAKVESHVEHIQSDVKDIELPVAFDPLSVVVNAKNTFVDCLTIVDLKAMWEPAAEGKTKQ